MAGDEAPVKQSDLGVRTLSAIVMVAVAGTALWLGGWVWTILAIAVGGGVLFEWSRLIQAFAHSAAARVAWLLGGIFYIGLAVTVLTGLRAEFLGISPVLTVLATVVAIDVGAYFAGRAIGGPKIAPRISPSKTWAGLAGAMIAATAILSFLRGFETRWLLVGPLTAVAAQTGDFFESWMKRRAGVKDSGSLIPGHGGLFDRVDGLLAVMFLLGLCFMVPGLSDLLR